MTFCGNCDRLTLGSGLWSNDSCLIPEPHINYLQGCPTRRVECQVQNRNNDCKHWIPKRSWDRKVKDFLLWSGK